MRRKSRKDTLAFYNKMGQLVKKYGVKMVRSWTLMVEHTIISVFDAPSLDAVMKFSMEPEVMAWMSYKNVETRPMTTLEETMKNLK